MLEANRPRRPTRKACFAHVIVMREVAPSKTTNLLSKRLNVTERTAASRGKSVLTSDTGRTVHHYPNLGVVTANLTREEHRALSMDDAVLSVHASRVRRILAPRPGPLDSQAVIAAGLAGSKEMSAMRAFLLGASTIVQAFTQQFPEAGDLLPPRAEPAVAPRVHPKCDTEEDPEWSWALSIIGMAPGYSTATGKGVKVAILDSGVDLDHPDFAGRFAGHDNTESFVDGEDVDDRIGHGTHVAGIVAGAANSSGGIRYSVAPDAELLIGKVIDNGGDADDDNILSGIAWAAQMEARVINLSLGSPRNVDDWFEWDYEVLAQRLAEAPKPAILIAAAGNDSDRDAEPPALRPVENPAAAPSIVAVAACAQDLQVASFSDAELDTIGVLDVSAPGVDIYSAYNDGSFARLSLDFARGPKRSCFG